MKRVLVSLVGLVFVWIGCRRPEYPAVKPLNPYEIHYRAIINPGNEVEPPPAGFGTRADGVSLYYYSDNAWQDDLAMMENGYEKIGFSSFNGPESVESESGAMEQAVYVGAPVVLLKSKYIRTKTKTLPYTVKNEDQVVTSLSSGSATAVGSGGVATVFGLGLSASVVEGGTTTIALPYETDMYDYLATYWAKRKKFVLGARWIDLSQEARTRIQRNTGAQIIAVVKGTTAFYANLLPRDIVLKVNDVDILDGKHLMELLNKCDKSRPTTFLVQRGSGLHKIDIMLS